MERDWFVFYKSFITGIDTIPDTAEQLKAYKYIIRYWIFWECPEEENSIAYGFFSMAKPQIDANNKRFANGKKWWQFWHLWWAPEWNQNAVKSWNNSQNNPNGVEQNNPKTTPKDKDKDKEKEKEKGCGGKREANNMLDANASRWIVAKKNVYDEEIEALRLRLGAELNVDVINKIVEFDKVKKWKKIRKYAEAQIKAFITTLNTRPTDKEKIDMLNTCIWNDYQWIYRNNRAQPVKAERPSWNLFH